jgi:hypothetical protein
MAFNPFTSFRRHQKTIFATMAIVCMLLFVLSSGVGGTDLLQQFGDWFSRGRGGKGDEAASIDGKKVSQDTVGLVLHQRKMADQFMRMVTELAYSEVFANIARQRSEADPELQKVIDQYGSIEQLKSRLQLPMNYLVSSIDRLQQQLRQIRLTITLGNAANKGQQTAMVDTLYTLMDRELQQMNKAIMQDRQGFFGGYLDKTEDALDFMLWKKQADRLNIRMMKEDINHAVSMETMGQILSPQAAKFVDQMLREKFRGYSMDMLNAALTDEFRVRAAKTSLLGEPAYTKTAPPVTATPDELFDWYKDVRTTVRVGLIEVPVAKFVSQVTETPTDAQLKELYDKHKNEEYAPYSEQPGFKEPRKVKIDWIALPNDSPYYKKVSELAPVFAAIGQFGTSVIAGDGGPAFGFSALLAARQVMTYLPQEQLFREYVQAESSATWTSPYAFGIRSGVHDSSVMRPENIAVLLGAVAGGGVTNAGPLTAPLALESRVIVCESTDRARIGASIILSAALDPVPLGIDALFSQLVPKPPTEATVAPILAERHRERLIDGLMKSDREWFTKEIKERNKTQDRNNVEAFTNEFIHTRQLRRGGTAEAVDQFALADDPGVAELRTTFQKARKDPIGTEFASELADSPAAAKPELFQPVPLGTSPTVYMHWRTEDREARAITFEQAKPKVEAAWRFEKARPLAKAEADRLANEAKNKTEMELRDLAAKTSSRGLIELLPMARLNPSPSFGTGGSPRYDLPSIPQEKVRYAGALVNTVMDLRKENAGSTVVAPDFPKSNYYVAALISKEVPTADAFRIVYKASMGPPNFRDILFDYYANELQNKYRVEVTKQLRTEAKLEVYKHDKKSEDEGS